MRVLTLHLVGALPQTYYAVFTNGTLNGAFFAASDGVCGEASGALEISVAAKEPSKFFTVGVSAEPISEGDSLVPGDSR